MKISEVIGDNSSEDKALAGLAVQTANLKLRKVHNDGKPKPPKPSKPSRPTGSKPARPPMRPVA